MVEYGRSNEDEMNCEIGTGFGDNLDELLHGAYRNLGDYDDGSSKGPNQ